jgi:hypothetical protein
LDMNPHTGDDIEHRCARLLLSEVISSALFYRSRLI